MNTASRPIEDPFREMVDLMPAPAWSSRPDGAAEFFNRGWLEYTGLCVDEALEWGWTVALHSDDVNTLVPYWQSVLAAGEPAEIQGRLRRFRRVGGSGSLVARRRLS
jgi:PAS domain-containing protein